VVAVLRRFPATGPGRLRAWVSESFRLATGGRGESREGPANPPDRRPHRPLVALADWLLNQSLKILMEINGLLDIRQ
jgi:hypothetical protein